MIFSPKYKRLIHVICLTIFFLIAFGACTNNQDIVQIKKDLEAYKSQVDTLKAENEKLKQELLDLQNNTENIQDLNEISSVSNSTILNTLNSEEYKTVNIGDEIIFTDIAEIVIEKCEFTQKVLPSKPEGYYSYYEEKDKNNIYFHVIGKYKNLGTEDQSFDDIPIKFEAKYQDKYKYTGFKVTEKSGGSDFNIIAYAIPLTNLKFHVLITVPLEVKESGSLDFIVYNGSDKYKIIVK